MSYVSVFDILIPLSMGLLLLVRPEFFGVVAGYAVLVQLGK